MTRAIGIGVALLFFSLFLPGSAGAQDTAERRRVALVVSSIDGNTDTEDYDLITRVFTSGIDELLAAYDLELGTVLLDEQVRTTGIELPSERRVSRILGELDSGDSNVVIGVFVLNVEDELFAQFVLYDPRVNTVLGGVLTRLRRGMNVFAGVESALEKFDAVVRRLVSGGYFAEEPQGLVESITVRGAGEGAEISLVDRVVGNIRRGELLVPYVQYEIGDPIRVVATKPGYHRIEQARELEERIVVLDLPRMKRKTRVDIAARWTTTMVRGAGIAARFHLNPDVLFLSFEQYRTFEPEPASNARPVYYYDYNLGIGRYLLFDYRSPLRLHLSVGAGVIVSDVGGLDGRDYADWYLVMGDPTLELQLGRLALFARTDLRYALGLGYNALGRVWIRSRGGFVPLTAGVRWSW